MLSRRATIEVLDSELTCSQCEQVMHSGWKIVMLQVSDGVIEPCCVRCFIEILMDSTEIFFVLPEPLPVYKGEPRPR